MADIDPSVAKLADAVLDGEVVDWAAVEATASQADRALILHLRTVADVARVANGVATHWGHFRVLERIGSGAFGEVYRAWDSRLDREVALKVLPTLTGARNRTSSSIIEEGRLLARVRHPNVVTIYGAEQIGDRIGLWMEFVQGRTLKQCIDDGKLFSGTEAIRIGTELCDAVTAVHDAGLLHRDIKAQNVMLSDSGRAMLMDLGTGREFADSSVSDLAGTPLYLAPEVLQGRSATTSSDIYSLGVLLYHIVTGRYPVEGRTVSALRQAHERNQRTTIRAARPDLSPKLARIIERAIDPRPEHRYQTAKELGNDLAALRRPAVRTWAAYAGAAAAVLVAFGAAYVWTTRSGGNADGASSTRAAGQVVQLTSLVGSKRNPMLSPDGNRVAFEWDRGSGFHIYISSVHSDTSTQITRGSGGVYPTWLPDGKSLTFIRRIRIEEGARDVIITTTVDEGTERTLLSDPALDIGAGLNWSPDGEHLVITARHVRGQPWRLMRLALATGDRTWLTTPPSGSFGDSYPVFSPDGGRIAFVRNSAGESGIYVLRAEGGEPFRVWAADVAVRRPAWGSDGQTLFFTSHRGVSRNSLLRISVNGGQPEPVAGTGEGATDPSVARAAERLVYVQHVVDDNLYRVALTDGDVAPATRLPSTTRQDAMPDISPDGSRIVFVSDRTGYSEIWVMEADGTNPVQLTTLKSSSARPRWSPDGRFVAFTTRRSTSTQPDVRVLEVASKTIRQLTSEPWSEAYPSWSADSQHIYFLSDRGGSRELWRIPLAGGRAEQVTNTGGRKAWESRDGRFLYYSDESSSIYRVPPRGGMRELVFKPQGLTSWGGEWVLASDGVYWLNGEVSPRPSIDFFNFEEGRPRRAVTPPGTLSAGSGFSVSPDGRWIVFAQRDYIGSDIMMIDGIR